MEKSNKNWTITHTYHNYEPSFLWFHDTVSYSIRKYPLCIQAIKLFEVEYIIIHSELLTVIIQSFKVQIFSCKYIFLREASQGYWHLGFWERMLKTFEGIVEHSHRFKAGKINLRCQIGKRKYFGSNKNWLIFVLFPLYQGWGLQDKFFVQFTGIHSVKAKAGWLLLLIPGSFLTSGHRRQRLHCSNERIVSSIMDSWDSEAHPGCLLESVGSSLLLISDMQRHLEQVTQLSSAEMLRWAKWLSWEIIIQLGTLVWNTWLYMMHIKAIWIHNF